MQNNELKNDGSVYANRFRYFIRNILPFQQQKTFAKGMFAALQNEVFVNIGNTANVPMANFLTRTGFTWRLGYRLNVII